LLAAIAATPVFLLFTVAPAFAQQQAPPPDTPVTTNKISNNFYTLDGRGGRVGLIVGADGVFMVDSQFPDMTQKLVAAIKQVTPNPVKFLVNTHLHGDHTGGNENLGKMGVTILSRPMLRQRLAHPTAANATPAPAAALPKATYDTVMTMHMNGEEIQLIPIRNAHTDGDTLIRFVNNDAVMTGDYYRSVGYPFIDVTNGGSVNGMIAGLGQTLGVCGPTTKVIPGHGPVVTRAELQAHRDMLIDMKNRVQALIDQGRTLEQVVAANVTASYDAKVEQGAQTKDRSVTAIFQSLTAN
jgi:glyoxylase-like metal-dependent hydrolase (beta-lactamase superfamily II)